MNPTNPILVSVIVTTKNEEKNIANCLRSIKNSINSINPTNSINSTNSINLTVEIIVVDNNSTDNTVKIAREFTDKVYNKGPERSAQRNFGVEKARGKYILYLDADMSLSERVIEECVNKCEKEDYVALYIPERVVGRGFWIKVRDFERSFYNATCTDCVRFVRRDKFKEIGGFDERLTGPEDWDFDRRIKEVGNVDIINSLIYHNEGKFSFRKYINKKLYYAQSFNKYIQKWGRNDVIIKKQLGFWYRVFWVFIENGKIFKLLSHPLLASEMYFLRGWVGLMYILGRKKKGMILAERRVTRLYPVTGREGNKK